MTVYSILVTVTSRNVTLGFLFKVLDHVHIRLYLWSKSWPKRCFYCGCMTLKWLTKKKYECLLHLEQWEVDVMFIHILFIGNLFISFLEPYFINTHKLGEESMLDRSWNYMESYHYFPFLEAYFRFRNSNHNTEAKKIDEIYSPNIFGGLST